MKLTSFFTVMIFVTGLVVSSCAGNPASDRRFIEVKPESTGLNLQENQSGEPMFFTIPAQPSLGFHFEYHLFIPAKIRLLNGKTRLLVEPNNTGTVSDSHSRHAQSAQRLITDGYVRTIAERVRVPLLVPAFDRPETGWQRYTHALDSDTMKITGGKLQRIDLQLIAMIEHAIVLLEAEGISAADRVFLNGFSASGNFANRFTALHPSLIRAAACGGINGMPILPLSSMDGYDLPFHVGTADIQRYTEKPFDIDSYRRVAQYLYMGELDENDTLPYDDAYNEDEREVTKNVLGETMAERWQKSRQLLLSMDLPVQCVTYADIGHQITSQVMDDAISFFEANLGESITFIHPSGEIVEGMKHR